MSDDAEDIFTFGKKSSSKKDTSSKAKPSPKTKPSSGSSSDDIFTFGGGGGGRSSGSSGSSKRKKSSDADSKSTKEQVTGLLRELPRGIVGLGGDVVKQVTAQPKFVYRTVRAAADDDYREKETAKYAERNEGKSRFERIWSEMGRDMPLVTETVESVGRTGKRIGYAPAAGAAAAADWVGADGVADDMRENPQVMPGFAGAITELAGTDGKEAVEEYTKNPVATVVEDVGNVALVAGGIGAVAKGGLSSGGRQALTAQRAADRIAKKAARQADVARTAATAADKAGDAARASKLRAAADAAETAARTEIDDLLVNVPAEALEEAASFRASGRGQVAEAADLTSGAANRLDPTDILAKTAVRGTKAAASKTFHGVANALDQGGVAGKQIVAPKPEVAARMRAWAEDRSKRKAHNQVIDEGRAWAARETGRLAEPIIRELDTWDKTPEQFQAPASAVAYGEARLIAEMPELVRLVDENHPAAREALDAWYNESRVPSEQRVNVDQMRTALDYERGTLAPEDAVHVKAGIDALESIEGQLHDRYGRGYGESAIPDADELARRQAEDIDGTGPRQSIVNAAASKQVRRVVDAQEQVAKTDRRIERAERKLPEDLRPAGGIVDAAKGTQRAVLDFARTVVAERPDVAAKAVGRPGKNVSAEALAGRLTKSLDMQAKGSAVGNADLAGLLDELDRKPAPTAQASKLRPYERATRQAEKTKATVTDLRQQANSKRTDADRLVAAASKAGDVTDAVVAKAQTARTEAARLDRHADLTEAFGPDVQTALADSLDDALAQPVKSAVEAQKRQSAVNDLYRRRVREGSKHDTQIRKLEAKVERVLNSPSAAPPAWQPALMGAQRFHKWALDQAAKSPAGSADNLMYRQLATESSMSILTIIERDLDRPIFGRGGYASKSDKKRTVVDTSDLDVTRKKIASEHTKTTGVMPRNAKQAAKVLLRDASDAARNETGRRILETHGRTGKQLIEEFETSGRVFTDPDGNTLKISELHGEQLARAMEDAGWVAFNPALRDFRVPTQQVGHNTLFVERGLDDRFGKQFKPGGEWERNAQRFIDKPLSYWKKGVLGLSPRWNVGNILGNALMLTFDGVRPWDAAAHVNDARKLRKAIKDGTAPSELMDLLDSGYFATAGRDLTAGPGSRAIEWRPKVRGKEITPIEWSFAANQYIDDISRSIVYLERTKTRGFSPAKAVADAQKALGNYSLMKPWEQQFATRALPWYRWQRHVTQLAFRLPVEHPVRTAWMLSIADRWGGDEEQPAWMTGAKIGDDTFVPIPGVDVFSDIGYGTGSVNPFAAVAYRQATGTDPSGKNLKDFDGDVDKKELLKRDILGLNQWTRTWRDRDGIVRSADGDAIKDDYGDPLERERWDSPAGTMPHAAESVVRTLGVPYPRDFDDESWREREEAKRRRRKAKKDAG